MLSCARRHMTLNAVNAQLEKECLDHVRKQEWDLWVNYYSVIVKNDPYFEHELINNNRSLAWFANELNRRKRKQVIS